MMGMLQQLGAVQLAGGAFGLNGAGRVPPVHVRLMPRVAAGRRPCARGPGAAALAAVQRTVLGTSRA